MKTVKILLEGLEYEIPEADLAWFISEKGAKEVKAEAKTEKGAKEK